MSFRSELERLRKEIYDARAPGESAKDMDPATSKSAKYWYNRGAIDTIDEALELLEEYELDEPGEALA